MVTLDAQSGTIGGAPADPHARRERVRRITERAAFGLSLVAAALVGAVAANQWGPVTAHHALAVIHAPRHTAPAAVSYPTPPPPTRVLLTANGVNGLPNGAWMAERNLTLRVTLAGLNSRMPVRAQAEVQPAGAPFTGMPTESGSLMPLAPKRMGQEPVVLSNLPAGQLYHWRARVEALNGRVSPWTTESMFGVSTVAPLSPALAATNLRIGNWSSNGKLLFRWVAQGSSAPIAYFEYAIVRAGVSLAVMHPNWHQVQGSVLTVPRWREGRWELLVRAVDQAGARSRTAVWPFSLVWHAPPAPQIVAARPTEAGWSNIAAPTVQWSVGPDLAPVKTFQYAVLSGSDKAAADITWTSTLSQTLTLPALPDGDWQVLIRSVNTIGMASPALRWSFHLDREHPLVTDPVLSAPSFTEGVEKLHVAFKIGKASTISYRIYRAGFATPVGMGMLGERRPGPVRDLVWNGEVKRHHLVAGGTYWLVIDAVDRVGNRTEVRTPAVTLFSKRILISLRKEALWAYDGDKLLYYTLVSNGGPDTPTLPGIFHVEGKYTGFVFHSPWPKGSPYWYPPSPTSYALLYNANGGYFLHDAPWRSNFGPGSNSVAGIPGGNYTGTHGCTNVPLAIMGQIFNWADVGTLIQIVP